MKLAKKERKKREKREIRKCKLNVVYLYYNIKEKENEKKRKI
jgi:hypothetical protein